MSQFSVSLALQSVKLVEKLKSGNLADHPDNTNPNHTTLLLQVRAVVIGIITLLGCITPARTQTMQTLSFVN